MEKIDTSHIKEWPDSIMLGVAEIKAGNTLDILSEKEREEYNGFSNANRKAEYLSARHLFHSIFLEMGLPVAELELKKEKSGKPFAEYNEERIYVSFSHSPHKVYCAVSREHDIGLDVELIDREINKRVVDRILNEQELYLAGEENPIRLWTIKEAAVKSLGTGLRTNLRDLTIQKSQKNRFSVRFNNDKLFEICSFRVTDHQIALAY